MVVKILGMGCSSCQRMYNEVKDIIRHFGWDIQVEHIQDIDQIMAYGVIIPPSLVIDERVVLSGYRERKKIEQVLQSAIRDR